MEKCNNRLLLALLAWLAPLDRKRYYDDTSLTYRVFEQCRRTARWHR